MDRNVYLNIAQRLAMKCREPQRNLGWVIVKDDHIVSSGHTMSNRNFSDYCDLGLCCFDDNSLPLKTSPIYGIGANTVIKLLKHENMSIKNLYKFDRSYKPIILYTENFQTLYDANISIKPLNLQDVITITFGTNGSISCTPDQCIMMSNGLPMKASDLHCGMSVMGYDVAEYGLSIISTKHIISIEKSKEQIACYDISTPLAENFAIQTSLNSGVFLHNYRSIHSAFNSMITTRQSSLIEADMYIAGYNKQQNHLNDIFFCQTCEQRLINSGIKNVIIMNRNGKATEYDIKSAPVKLKDKRSKIKV